MRSLMSGTKSDKSRILGIVDQWAGLKIDRCKCKRASVTKNILHLCPKLPYS